MKEKIICAALAAITLACVLAACSVGRTEINRVAIDRRYVEAYEAVETEYGYQFDAFAGSMRLMPEVKTVHHDPEYRVLYRITYDDGSEAEVWETVTSAEYEKAR